MLRLTIFALSLAISFTAAHAAHAAHGTMVKIPSYDYAKEKKAGYVKDYCEDSIGNHIACASPNDAKYKAEVVKTR